MLITFHNHLRSLLHRRYRDQAAISAPLARRASIKDLVESFGVPHTEIGRLLSNGREVSFHHLVEEEAAIDVYPLAGPDDFLTATALRPDPLPGLIFAADSTVGKLARLLRLTGLDTFGAGAFPDLALPELATAEHRILLSRNRELLRRKTATHGYLIKKIIPEQQLVEVIEFFDLGHHLRPFSRCMACNGRLRQIDKQKIITRLEPLTRIHYHTFQQCPQCARIYWAGSHQEKMAKLLDRCLPAAPAS